MVVDELFDGWWMVVSLGRDQWHCYDTDVVQVFAGDTYDIEKYRGPWPTSEDAEAFRWRDCVRSYWEHGMPVYADHCKGCGRFAKVLAFDHAAKWAWRVTECKQCGVIDSRS